MNRLVAPTILLFAFFSNGTALDGFDSTCTQIAEAVSPASTVSLPRAYSMRATTLLNSLFSWQYPTNTTKMSHIGPLQVSKHLPVPLLQVQLKM